VKRLAGTIAVLLVLAGAESAAAASEVGSRCEPRTILIAGIEEIVFPLATSGGMPPTSSPINGVATSWTVRSESTDAFTQRLKVLRTATGADTVQVLAEAPPQQVRKGSGPFPIRIPVQAGDRFGLSGVGGGVIACSTGAPEDVVGATSRNGQPGQSESFSRLSGYQLPLTVMVEPDADGDGYGDETQDRCPASAAVYTSCPTLGLVTFHSVRRRAILVRVTMTNSSATTVWGQVSWWGKRRGGDKRRVLVNLGAGPRRPVTAGTTATFRLPLPKSVLWRLRRLSPAQGLRANLTVGVKDVYGAGGEQPLTIRLRGRG
jgi:hypothetical protein